VYYERNKFFKRVQGFFFEQKIQDYLNLIA
jgi:hypothetical protein